MEAYHIDRFGSVDGIVLRSSEDARPGRKEILMQVRATSLNYRDLMVLKGGGRGPTKIGVVPLSDGAGEVAAIGDGVTRVKLGDRIAGCFHPRWFGGPIKPGLPDRPARRQSRWGAGGIRGLQRRGGRGSAKSPVLRGSRDVAVRCGDRLGGADGASSGYRGRHSPYAGFRGCVGLCSAIPMQLYDRRRGEVSVNQGERIVI